MNSAQILLFGLISGFLMILSYKAGIKKGSGEESMYVIPFEIAILTIALITSTNLFNLIFSNL
jgi:hypothetical protein